MYIEGKTIFRSTVLGMLLTACTFATGVSGQGWISGGKSAKSPGVSKSVKPAEKTAKSGKTAAASTGTKMTAAGTAKKTATVAGASTDSPAKKGTRERRVNNKAAAKNAEVPTKKSEDKSTAAAATSPKPGRCDPEKEDRTDLSGTYNGKVDYPDAGLVGDATLTIIGNHFTLNSGSNTKTGNFTAVTTCNYTAVAMMFGEWKTPQPGEPVLPPLPMLSLRATKKGDQLSLMPSASERRVFSFDSAQKK
ncbi:MAG: hypothetical protein JWM21_2142 [Acidobacteria bacterium]|nr:hypothetical protein [Acidobacteriota bacterium]